MRNEKNQPRCEAFEAQLSAYVLGETEFLSEAERAALDEHVAACGACREEVELLRKAAQSVERAAPRAGVLESARRSALVGAAGRSVARRPVFLRPTVLSFVGLAAAAAVVVALLVRPWDQKEGGHDGEMLAMAPAAVRAALSDEVLAFEGSLEKQKRIFAGVEGVPGVDGRLMDVTDAAVVLDANPTTRLAFEPPARTDVPTLEAAPAGETIYSFEAAAKGETPLVSRKAGSVDALTVNALTDLQSFQVGVAAPGDAADAAYKRDAYTEAKSADGLAAAGPAGPAKPASSLRQLAEELREREVVSAATDSRRTLGGLAAKPAPDASAGGAVAPEDEARGLRARLTGRSEALEQELALRRQNEGESKLGAARAPADLGAVPAPTEPARGDAADRSKAKTPALEPPAALPPATALGRAPVGPAPGALPGGAGVEASKEDPGFGVPPAGGASAPPAIAANAEVRARIDAILTQLDRRPGETPADMFFRFWGDNPFVEASSDPLSTFAVDVDTASYTLLRAHLFERGILPPPKAVRTEECVNYFKSDYAPPPQDSAAAFAIHTELAPSSFAHDSSYRLLKVGLKGREVSREKRKSCSLVFVVDTSGSMRQQNRLELVKDALRLLAAELDEGDTVGIVSFDVDARVVLDPTAASKREVILDAISRLQPNRNTNVNAGLTLGYELAARAFLPGGSNRVILCSDGVANTGLTVDPQVMGQNVRAQRLKGIYLTSVGVGMGNHNDTLMEQLADQGDGQCVYVDRLDEAKKVFVDSLTGTLEAIARDVKVQVEFDKDKVVRYRQLGYENRALADAAFRDNTVDAGEVGSGHEVTCLYEVKCAPGAQGRLATVRVRYLTVDQKDGVEHREPVEIEHAVEASSERASFAQASARFRLSACVAEFAEVLRDSYWARGADLLATAKVVEEQLAAGELGQEQDVVELVALMKKADALVRMRLQSADAVAQVEDALRENSYLRSRLEDFQRRDSTEDLRHLDDLRRQNDELRRRLEGMLEKTFR